MMSDINHFIEYLKSKIKIDTHIPLLYVSDIPLGLQEQITRQNIIIFSVIKKSRVTTDWYLKYGNIQKVTGTIVNNFVISFIDFLNLFHADKNLIIQICQRNLYIISTMLEDNSLLPYSSISEFDKHIINDSELATLQHLDKDICNDLITDFKYEDNYLAKLILYITAINKYKTKKEIQQEIDLLSTSIVHCNISGNIDIYIKFMSDKKEENKDNINEYINFKLRSDIFTILKKIKSFNLLYIVDSFNIKPSTYNMSSQDAIAFTIINIHTLLSAYTKKILICSSGIYKQINSILYIIKYKYYIRRIYFLDIEDIKNKIFDLIELGLFISNKYITVIAQNNEIKSIDIINKISKQLNKNLIIYYIH